MKKILLFISLVLFLGAQGFAQSRDVASMTKEDIMNLSYDELLEMPFEDVLHLADIMGVSMDELFAMVMNKNVSSASKSEETAFTSPLSSTVLTKAEIRAYGISTIEEAFRLIPGMIVTEKTNGMYDVQMRGLNNIPDNQMFLYTENSNTLLMIDGRIAHNYAMGALCFDMLPISIEDIDRIEVVRGANSALYGLNAVNGVINIITEKANANSKNVAGSVQIGTQDTYVGDLALRKQFNSKLSAGVTANFQYRRRPTNQLYVMPGEGVYKSTVPDNMLPGIGDVMPVVTDAEGNPIYSADGTKIPLALAAGHLVPVEEGYYNAEDIDKFRQVFTMAALLGSIPESSVAGFLQTFMERNPGATPEQAQAYIQGMMGSLASGMDYNMYKVFEYSKSIDDMFPDPGLARKNLGLNGYLSYNPIKDVRFDLSVGYQQSDVLTTSCGDQIMSFDGRTSKTGYVNLNADVFGLNLKASYTGGPQDYEVGTPGFKIGGKNLNLSAEYNFKFGDLNVRPGFAYLYIKAEDYTPDFVNPSDPSDYTWKYYEPGKHTYDESVRHLSGFMNYDAKITDYAPSLRLDYKIGKLRAIAAVRADKYNIPDKWINSYQGALDYEINDNNFVRASYSNAKRSAVLVNTSSDYHWYRSGMMSPDESVFLADEDAPLMKINSAELGYRWKPFKNVLIDAEAYYSVSEDYGALMADNSNMTIPGDQLKGFLLKDYKNLIDFSQGEGMNLSALSGFIGQVKSTVNIKYGELPYKVKQFGFGVNVDWVISPKLVAKLNANVQNTTIDNYYMYNQEQEILGQMGQTAAMIARVPALVDDLWSTATVMMQPMLQQCGVSFEELAGGNLSDESKAKMAAMAEQMYGVAVPEGVDIAQMLIGVSVNGLLDMAMAGAPVDELMAIYNGLDDAGKAEMMNQLYTMTYTGNVNGEPLGANSQYSGYYALKYGVRNEDGIFKLGGSEKLPYTTVDGHKHKATPTAYGMIGLIYRPTEKINISTFGNYIGKRTYQTKYGEKELKQKFTVNMKVGYKPVDGFELFFNAHNLFNTKDREFVYSDEIGGIYSVGINFGF